MLDFLHYYAKVIIKICLRFFWLFPVKKNRITLLNELSFTYGDNLKYLNEYIQKNRKLQYEIIFPLKEVHSSIPCIVVKPFSFLYFKYLLTSEVIITNCGGVSYLPLRKKQLCISTWHGGGPYKKTGNIYSSKWYRKEMEMYKKNVKFMLSSCSICTDYEAKDMLFEKTDCVNFGSPRIDLFFDKNLKLKEKVYKYYNIPLSEKLVLYAPTFRHSLLNVSTKNYLSPITLDFDNLINSLETRFGGKFRLAIRLHPKLDSVYNGYESAVNCTAYPDIQELLYAADVVVTDFSSLMWDFSFTERPCFLYAEDIDEYERTRGFYMPSSQWPYPIARTNQEMEKNILNFAFEQYSNNLKKHYIDCGCFETGNACEKTLKLIEERI